MSKHRKGGWKARNNADRLSGKFEVAKARRVWRALLRRPWDKALKHTYTNISPLARQKAGLPLDLDQQVQP